MGTVSTTLPSDGQTIDASDVNTPINAILSEFNGNIDDNNIKTGANINGAKLLAASVPGSALDTTLAGGWISGGLPAYSSATNNGNKSYDIVFASTVASLLSPGMRLRTTRTVTAPTQCADLEASSSQYFSATSASLSGVTFTDDFTCSAWVKLESYTGAIQTIISRVSGTSGWAMDVSASGAVRIFGWGGGNGRQCTSYQALPLGKWVHVAGSMDLSGSSGLLYIDGVLVPSTLANLGAGGITLTQAGNLEVGSQAGAAFLDGKIAQVAVFSSVLSASTIRSYMSQGLSGSESTLVSAYSCNNSLLDLNTTNNNDLTANGGAAMTATDSPFGQDSNGVTAGTTDYELVMKVNGATATVQVPEGCTIPTSGGVSAVAYSTATSPFGFTLDKGRWLVEMTIRAQTLQTTATASTWYNMTTTTGVSGGTYLTVPVGIWSELGYIGVCAGSSSGADIITRTTLSTANNTESDTRYTSQVILAATSEAEADAPLYRFNPVSLSAATPYYLNNMSIAAANGLYMQGAVSPTTIRAIPAGV